MILEICFKILQRGKKGMRGRVGETDGGGLEK